MKTIKILTFLLCVSMISVASANLKIVTTTSDLASLAKSIGGSKVATFSFITGARDAHRIEAKPSYMSRLSGADLFIAIGLDLEIGYEDSILQGASNSKVAKGASGHLHAGDFAYILEKPIGAVTRAMGDIHPDGNPHVWLDPYNGRLMAKGIEARMSKLDPANAAYFQGNLDRFIKVLDEAMFGRELVAKFGGSNLWEWSNENSLRPKIGSQTLGGWAGQMASMAGSPIVTYHRSWSYFARRFGLKVVDELEPKPGLDPSPGHLATLIRESSRQGVKLILQEPFFSRRHADFVGSRINAQVIVAPLSVGQDAGAKDYISLFDTIVAKIKGAK